MEQMKPKKRRGTVWRRLKKSKTAMLGLGIIAVIVFMAVFADLVAPYPYDIPDATAIFQYPSWEHIMGTDDFGRDTLAGSSTGPGSPWSSP